MLRQGIFFREGRGKAGRARMLIFRIHWGLLIINLWTVTWWDLDQMTERKLGGEEGSEGKVNADIPYCAKLILVRKTLL